MLPRVPCILGDEDELPDALDDLHEAGATEEVVHGPGDVRLRADVGDDQRRDALIGMAVGPLVLVTVLLLGNALLFDAFDPMGTEGLVIAGLGVLVGVVGGAFYGTIAGLLLHPDGGPEIHVGEGEVLVFAHGEDPDRLTEILEDHGARCIRPAAMRQA